MNRFRPSILIEAGGQRFLFDAGRGFRSLVDGVVGKVGIREGLGAPTCALRQPERGVDARGLLRASLANRYPANEDATMRHAGAANMSRVSFEAGLCQYRINEEISKGVPGMFPAAQSKTKNTSEKAKPDTATPAKKPFLGRSPA